MTHRLKRMDFGEVLDTAFLAFRDDLWLLCLVIGAVLFVPQVVMNLIGPLMQQMVRQSHPGDLSSAGALLLLSLVVFGGAMVVIVVGPFANAAAIKIVADRFLGRPTSFGAAYRHVFGRFWNLVVAVLLSGLAVTAGIMCGCLPGVFLLLQFYVVTPAVVLERVDGVKALGRSGRLMEGRRLQTLALFVVLWFLLLVLGALPGLVRFIWIEAPLTALLNIASTAFLQVLKTVIYLNARCEKEGFDLVVKAGHLAARDGVQELAAS